MSDKNKNYGAENITVLEEDNVIHLYCTKDFICSYKKNTNFKYNYKEEDYMDVLEHSSFNGRTEEEINEFIKKNLNSLDGIYIDKGEKNDRGIK